MSKKRGPGRPSLGKNAMTPSERQAASFAARKERGLVQVKAWIEEEVHARLKKIAAQTGESVADLIARKLQKTAAKPRSARPALAGRRLLNNAIRRLPRRNRKA